MGLSGSVAWAQSASEVALARAKLPASHRLIEGRLAPGSLPIWASIIDDVWALEEEFRDVDPVAPAWMDSVGRAWDDMGVQTNISKDVFAEVCGEAQGAFIRGEEFCCGVRRDKRLGLMQGCVKLLSSATYSCPAMERFVGKWEFAPFFKTGARSLLGATYEWITAAKRSKKRKLFLWDSVRDELCLACLLVPSLEINLRAPWCERLEASDASPGGAGRACIWLPEETISLACRTCDSKDCVHQLVLGGERVVRCGPPRRDEAGPVRCESVGMDESRKAWWLPPHQCGGGSRLGLEHSRAPRPTEELGCRVLHAVDSTAVAGAVRKGRSSSRQLNRVLRKIFGLGLAGDLELFVAWLATSENPADAPSSWYGVRSKKGRGEVPAHERVLLPAEAHEHHGRPVPQRAALPGMDEMILAGASPPPTSPPTSTAAARARRAAAKLTRARRHQTAPLRASRGGQSFLESRAVSEVTAQDY